MAIERKKKEETKLSERIASVPQEDENKLRPQYLKDYIGQSELKQNLEVLLEAAKLREESMDHILFHGPPGLGKTTIASIMSREAGVNLKITSGPAVEKQGDIASILTNLKSNDILFIDEIHRLKPAVEEILYSAMEDFGIDIVLGKGPSAKSMRLKVPRFTLIGATTKMSMISSPLRDRFGAVFKLNFYSQPEIEQIIQRSAQILNVQIEPQATAKLAAASRKTPRIANRLLKRARDFALVNQQKTIDETLINKTLKALGIDQIGLDSSDRRLLESIIELHKGGPVGLNTLAAALNEDLATVEEVYEPFLLQLGLLERTPRGRIVTPKAYAHLEIESPSL